MAITKQGLSEIQGLLLSGYARQRAMSCLLLKIGDAQSARKWLTGLVPQVTFGGEKKSPSKLNIAFTYRGLEQLIGPDELQGLSREFCEGMVTPHRQRVLGDLAGSPSDPQKWTWGGPNCDSVDVLLLAYANAMFQAMAETQRRCRVRRPVQVLLEEGMGCGTGICYGCAVEVRRGMRLVCKDGPKFELRDVF